MKKYLIALAALCGFAIHANAQTDLSTLNNVVYVAPSLVTTGGTQTIALNVKNENDLEGFQCRIILPSGFTFTGDLEVAGERLGTMKFELASCQVQADGSLMVIFGSTSGNVIPAGDGQVANIGITAPDAAEETYKATVVETVLRGIDTEADIVESILTMTDRWILDENATSLPAISGSVNVTVKRSIKAGQWSTIVLPFALNKAKAEIAFGTGAKYAQLQSVETTFVDPDEGDFSTVAITLDFKSYTLGGVNSLKTGVPYLIKTEDDIENFNVDGVTINNTVNTLAVNDVNFDDAVQARFTGSFVKTKVPADALFLSGSKLYYSTGNSNLKGFRGYFVADAIIGKVFGEVKMNYVIDGTTRINGVDAEGSNDAVYDLSGRRISKPQQRGIYIVNGKKVAVK